ncbi:putative histidine kinase sensor protein [Helicobacter sp. NHP19-012]|uniref:histidine kinase n=1 Tax=Helicobacter gastrofelis TaxID=2849642 RepID=A0ABM7SET4_9HELI|nr:ArsS family sensor histidine kinase [Helicobacter sp. NHP19-012]BCZ19307.1 putative histidine kinase sensor protein [Helicobacter sp. NHP19-012]
MPFSIFSKIVFLFVISITSFAAFSYYFIRSQIDHENFQTQIRHQQFITTINQVLADKNNRYSAEVYLHELGFQEITQQELHEILDKQKGIIENDENPLARIIKVGNKIFISLKSQGDTVLYKEIQKTSYRNYYFAISVGAFLITMIFVFMLQGFIPINELRKKVHLFSSGEMDIECKLDQQDEIGDLALAFDNAIKKIKGMNESRILFLRAIMHELRTPIAKGMIVAEMVDNSVQKERLLTTFKRLNALIEQFARIEQLSSKNYKITKEMFLMDRLLEHVKNMLLLDKGSACIVANVPNHTLETDFELFSLVVKNLLDNALKYSPDRQVKIETIGKDIAISNRGEPLKEDLMHYFKPYFHHENPSEAHGFGLGMYIIKSALDTLELRLSYAYKDERNIFTIHGCILQEFGPLFSKVPKRGARV